MNKVARNSSIDSAKFVLIMLMIFGHALEIHKDSNIIFEKIYTFIYSFHMPAFIILSGFFFKDTDTRRFWRGIGNLLITFFVFQILLFGDPLDYNPENGDLLTQVKNGLLYNITHIYKPTSALWYIVSLAFWRIILHCIPDKIRLQKMPALLWGGGDYQLVGWVYSIRA